MVAGANCFTAMAEFAASKLAWLRLYAPLENGAPSHDTFRYVFLLLKPTCFHAQLREALGEAVIKPGQHIAADGKSMRGTASPTWQKGALHVLRAYVNQSGLSILYQPCDAKSNEITALPELLAGIALEGCTVTMDAMGCQTAIAKQITDQGGDYLINLQPNQGAAYKAVEEYAKTLFESIATLHPHAHVPAPAPLKAMTEAMAQGQPLAPWSEQQRLKQVEQAKCKLAEFDSYCSEELNHGRYERREVYVSHDLSWWPKSWKWQGLQSVIIVNRTTHRGGARRDSSPTQEVSYYLGSAKLGAEPFATLIRDHWAVETAHHVLDVTFNEDHCQVRDHNAALNLSMLRDLAAAALKRNPSKASLPNKRLKAAWSEAFLTQIVACIFHT